jgi:cytochrome c oxidase assembly factor CtaG
VDPSLAELLLHWHWRPEVLLVLAALGAAYVRGWRRLRARERPLGPPRLASAWRLAAYVAGIGSVAVALLSPLEHLAETVFTAHMLQHQILLMVAPPLLLLGNPFPLVLWGLPRGLRRALGRTFGAAGRGRRAWRRLTWMPVAGVLYALNLVVWHLPVAYEAALRAHAIHDLEHLCFFGTSVLFWWPVVNPAPRLHRLRTGVQYGFRIAYLILAAGFNTLVGAVLGLSERLIYPSYAAAPRLFADLGPLDDQALGGGVMWSGSHMYLVAILVLLSRAMHAEDRAAVAAESLAREPGEPTPP